MSVSLWSGNTLHCSFKSQILTIKLRSKPDVGMFSTSDSSLCPEAVHHWPGLPWWKQLWVFRPLKIYIFKRAVTLSHLYCGIKGMCGWHRPACYINMLQREDVVRTVIYRTKYLGCLLQCVIFHLLSQVCLLEITITKVEEVLTSFTKV